MKIQRRKCSLRKRKLFFPAGMLSLVLLPLFGFRLLFSDPYFKKVHVLQVAYLSPQMMEAASSDFISGDIPTTSISGNPGERIQKIDSVIYRINYLQKNGNDSSLFQVNLDDQSTYGDFIAIINILKKEKVKVYAVNGNHIWIFPNTAFRPIFKRPAQQVKTPAHGKAKLLNHVMMTCGTYTTVPRYTPDNSPAPDSLQFLLETRNSAWLLGIFCLLLALNIYSIRKSFLREG